VRIAAEPERAWRRTRWSGTRIRCSASALVARIGNWEGMYRQSFIEWGKRMS
jgi:hypothetical protein